MQELSDEDEDELPLNQVSRLKPSLPEEMPVVSDVEESA